MSQAACCSQSPDACAAAARVSAAERAHLRLARLTPRNLALPVAIVVYFLFAYLKGVPTAGNDLYLVFGGVLLGLIFGIGAGVFTRVYRTDKGIYAKAGPLAATFWTVGVVLRTAFSLYATEGGAGADRVIGHIMTALNITDSSAIVACLLLMVLVEVGPRQLIVGARYVRLRSQVLPVGTLQAVHQAERP